MALNVQCKKCANLRNDWCKLVVDSPDPDMVRDCQYYRGNTNADRINAMPNEVKASILALLELRFFPKRDITAEIDKCYDKWLDWLKQEVESDG